MAEKRMAVKIITPRGRAVFPKLDKPDTKWKAEGQYTVKLVLPPTAFEAHEAKITAMLDEFFDAKKAALMEGDGKQKAKAKSLSKRTEYFSKEVDDEGEETGNIVANFKMTASGVSKKDGKPWTRKPSVFDSKGKKMNPCPPVWGGSILKVAADVVPYYNAKDNECGVTLRLEGVQIIDLKTGGNRDASDFGFSEEEGFTAEDESSGSTFSDESAGGAGGEEPDDF